MSRRRHGDAIPLTPKWLPLVAERLHDDALLKAGSFRRMGSPEQSSQWGSLARGLVEAELWWVTADMTLLAVDTAEDTDGFDGRTDVPEAPRCGLMVFDGGLPIEVRQPRLSDMEGVKVAACLWRATARGIVFQLYSADQRLARFDAGRGAPLHVIDDVRLTGERLTLLKRIIMATLALATRPGIAHERQESWGEHDGVEPRALAKARGRRSSGDVKYVYLHETHAPTGLGDGGERHDYACRWVVRGHYRDQAYGPAHSMRRRQWIAPYVKGPADKPLVIKAAVHIWRK